MNKIYVGESKDLGNDQWKINFMNVIDVIHQTAEMGLSPKETKDILCFSVSDWSFYEIFILLFL